MQFKVSEEFKNYMLLEDFITHKPEYEPLITIALSKNVKEFKRIDPWNQLKLAQNYFKTPH